MRTMASMTSFKLIRRAAATCFKAVKNCMKFSVTCKKA